MTRKINDAGLYALKNWEGLRLKAYKDSSGILTIGYGHTSSTGEPIVRRGMTITKKAAEDILKNDMVQYESAVDACVNVALTDNQFAALVSFCYNVGICAFKKSTLLKKLNRGDYSAVPQELMKWVNASGLRIEGLVNRRSAEVGLWTKGEYVTSGYIPATPKKEHALFKPETIGPLAGAIAGTGSLLSGTGPVQWALAGIMVFGCLLGAWYFVRRVHKDAG